MDTDLKKAALDIAAALNDAAFRIAALVNPPMNRRFSDIASGELYIDGKPLETVDEGMRILEEIRNEGTHNPLNVLEYEITVASLFEIMSRAVNTMDPHKMPVWAVELHDRLGMGDNPPLTVIFKLTA